MDRLHEDRRSFLDDDLDADVLVVELVHATGARVHVVVALASDRTPRRARDRAGARSDRRASTRRGCRERASGTSGTRWSRSCPSRRRRRACRCRGSGPRSPRSGRPGWSCSRRAPRSRRRGPRPRASRRRKRRATHQREHAVARSAPALDATAGRRADARGTPHARTRGRCVVLAVALALGVSFAGAVLACGASRLPAPPYVGQPTEALQEVAYPPPPARVEYVPPAPQRRRGVARRRVDLAGRSAGPGSAGAG